MGIEVRTSSSAWTQYYDPEIFTSSGWQNILFGEIYTGTGPNNGWGYFYVRINVVDPVISFVSRTQTSITINVTHSNPDADLVRVYVYRVGGTGAYYPNSSGTTGTVNANFTQSSLTLGTSYTFRAYAEYLDGNGNVMITSNVVEETYATSTFDLYTPSVPTLTGRSYTESGGVYSGTLEFTSSSNPNYSFNNSASYIQFQLTDGFGTTYTLNSSNLANNDTLQSRSVTFTGLGLGTQWVCRARTVYTTISEQSEWSNYSSAATTVNWTRTYVPGFSTWAHMQNSSYFTSFSTIGTSNKSGNPVSDASDGSNGTQWVSDPYTLSNTTTQESRSIVSTSFDTNLNIIEHSVSGSHNIPVGGGSTSGSTSISTLTFSLAGKCYTDASYIAFEISDSYAIVRGTGTIFNSGLSGVDGVTRSILTTQPVTGGIRRILFARPAGVPADQISSSGTLNIGSSSTINAVSVSSLGGSGTLYGIDSNSFNRFSASDPGYMPTTTTSGTVTYNVTSQTQVPKGAGTEIMSLFAAPTNMQSPRRNVRLESVSYRHGTISSPNVDIRVNGTLIATGSKSANTTLLSAVQSYNFSPNYNSSGGSGGNGWYLSFVVDRGISGSLYVSTVSEVQLRYSYEVLE